MTVSPVMQRLASYIAQAPKKRLPAAVAEKTKHHILDTIAAMVSGARLPPGKQAISYARTRGGTKEASVVATGAIQVGLALRQRVGHRSLSDGGRAETERPGCVVGGDPQAKLRALASRRAVKGRRGGLGGRVLEPDLTRLHLFVEMRHLGENLCVLRRDAVGSVEAADEVVEAGRAEQPGG